MPLHQNSREIYFLPLHDSKHIQEYFVVFPKALIQISYALLLLRMICVSLYMKADSPIDILIIGKPVTTENLPKQPFCLPDYYCFRIWLKPTINYLKVYGTTVNVHDVQLIVDDAFFNVRYVHYPLDGIDNESRIPNIHLASVPIRVQLS